MKFASLLIAVLFLFTVFAFAEDAPKAEEKAAEAATSAPAPQAEYPKFGLSAEAGVALSGGNSPTQSYSAKSDAKWLWEKDTIKALGQYFLAKAPPTSGAALQKTGENWKLGARYERSISKHFGVYLGNSWESDKFAGFSYRTNVDAGGQYYIFPGDRKENYWVTEAGYRYSYESRNGIAGATEASVTVHAIRLYTEAAKKLAPSILGKVWVEVLPDITNGSNLMINFEPSLSVVLSSVFSLKLAFLGKYDGLPAVTGNKKLISYIPPRWWLLSKEKSMAVFEEFKKFALKGNVVDMAVGIIIGAAFGKIVSSFVNNVIMPPLGILIGGVDFKNLKVVLKEAVGEAPAVTLNYGEFLQTVFDFLIVAWAIFIAVKVMNSLKKKEEAKPTAAPPKQEVLLTEIRDLLKK